MNFRIKETIYIKVDNHDTMVRIGTQGFVKNGVVYFPDVQAENFIGFPKNAVMSMKDLFKVTTTADDMMVHLDDIRKALGETAGMSKELQDEFMIKLSKYGA